MAFSKHPHCNVEISCWGNVRPKRQVNATVMAHVPQTEQGADLTLINVEHIDKMSLPDVHSKFNRQLPRVRKKQDRFFKMVYAIAKYLPQIFIRPFVQLYLFIAYDLNVTLKWTGLPRDPFGSFVVSNIGSFGLDEGTPPLVGLGRFPLMIALGKIIERPVVRNGKITIAPIMVMSANMDHRCFDGYQGSQLLNCVRKYIANPDLLLPSSITPSQQISSKLEQNI